MKLKIVLATLVISASLANGFSEESVYTQGFTFLVPAKDFVSYKEEVLKLLRQNGYINCNAVQRPSTSAMKKLNILCKAKSRSELQQIFNLLSFNAKHKLDKGPINNASY